MLYTVTVPAGERFPLLRSRGNTIQYTMAKQKGQLEQEQVERVASAVSDPRRFEMLRAIAAASSMTCSALRESQPISPATISHHLKELSEAGLVELEREGRTVDISFRRDVWDAYLATLSEL